MSLADKIRIQYNEIEHKQKEVDDMQKELNKKADFVGLSILEHFNAQLLSQKFSLEKASEIHYCPGTHSYGSNIGYEIILNMPEDLDCETHEAINYFRNNLIKNNPHIKAIIFRRKKS